jgi:hypothetical protein
MDEAAPAYGELASTFADIARTLFVERTVAGTLQRIVDFAQATVSGCDAASISLVTAGHIATPVCSDEVALEIDAYQYEFSEGPCLDAITSEPVLYSSDLTSDDRWPHFGPVAVGMGMRSLLSCRLSSDVTLGSLNLYARIPDAYGPVDRTKAIIFATHAGIALGAAGVLADATVLLDTEIRKSENLEIALTTREVIGQAEGILIERERLTPEHAFEVLRRASQNLNLRLRDLAQYVVDTGEVPKKDE